MVPFGPSASSFLLRDLRAGVLCVRGSRFLCFLLLLVAGPSIWLLLLVWLMGGFAFEDT